MSHYWHMTGDIEMSRELTADEFQELSDDHYFEFNKTTITWDDNEGNHLPSQIDDLVEALKGIGVTCTSDGGTYHAEDSMSGEWRLVDGEVETHEYRCIVEDLRRQIDLLKAAMDNSCDGYMDPDRILEAGSGS